MPDENVGLADVVEGLTRGLPLVLAVQLDEIVYSDMLFLGFLEHRGAALHDQRHALANPQDVLIVRLVEGELLFGLRPWKGDGLRRKRFGTFGESVSLGSIVALLEGILQPCRGLGFDFSL